MANRSSFYDVLILRSQDVPSGGRIVLLLSKELGIITTFVFGGGKSKLRSLASPWHYGRAWLYGSSSLSDEKNMLKLTDFDPAIEYANIRTNLDSIHAALFTTEFILATSAFGGEWTYCLELATQTLSILNEAACCSPSICKATIARALCLFILRATDAMGLMPDSIKPISAGALAWLNAARTKAFDEAVYIGLASESLAELKSFSFLLAQEVTGNKLRTLTLL